jgi:hypothetical protein
MLQDLFRSIFSFVFGALLEPFMEHQLHFLQSHLMPEIANTILNFISIPELVSFIRFFKITNNLKSHGLNSGDCGG